MIDNHLDVVINGIAYCPADVMKPLKERIEILERELNQEKQSREIAAEKAWQFADNIKKLETDLATTFKNFMAEGLRAEKLEAALDDALQYVSRADWHYLKDETRKALEGKDD